MPRGNNAGKHGGKAGAVVASPPAAPSSPSAPSRAPAAALPQQVPPFLSKCYDMVDDPSTDATVSWSSSGNTFVLWDPHAFVRDMLPKYFKHSNLSSFVRQLNTYGFHKVDPDQWEFANEGFIRGQKHLLKTIVRRKPAQNTQLTAVQEKNNSFAQTCVEVGKFGFEEEIESLKRDKAVLMQELVKLRQHQQNSDNELRHVRDKIQMMEQQQQQMLSFLAMAVQSPGFLAQLLQQTGYNWWMVEANKKRRLPALEHGTYHLEQHSEGQIVKYQSAMTENLGPLLPPTSNSDESQDINQMSDVIIGMNIDADNMPFEIDPVLPMDEGTHANIPHDEFADFDWFQLLVGSIFEDNHEVDPHISGFSGMDFKFPEDELHVESSQNIDEANPALGNSKHNT